MPIPLKVLLLEDREEDALLVLHELKRAGFAPEWRRVDTESGFAGALDASLDVILADYHLPGWSGVSALAVLQARGLDIPFIIVSGTIGEETAVDAMRRGAADYLLKDRLTRLGPAVYQQLENKRLRDEARAAQAAQAAERQHAEYALRESEERYRLLFQSSPLPMWVYDRQTLGFLAVNKAAVERYGYSEAEFLALTIRDIRPPDYLPRLDEALARIETGVSRTIEPHRHRRKSGEIIDVEISADSIVFCGREARLVLAIDVTERLKAEGALIESEARYRTVVDGAEELIYTISPEGELTSVNPAFEKLIGFSGQPFWNMIHDSERERAEKAWKNLLSGKPVPVSDLRLKTRGGGVRIFRGASSPTVRNGKCVQISGIGRDVTEQRQSESERRDLTRRLEMVLESTDEGLYAVDLNGICTMVNRSANRLLGYEPGELLGQHMHTAIHHTMGDGDPYPASECTVCPVTQNAQTVRTPEDVFWTKDGTSFPVAMACSPILEGETIKGSVVTFTDISARRSLEKQLEKANRLSSLGRLAATIAHEFNNVLMGIQPFAEVIARNAANQELVNAAGHISSGVMRGKKITQEILRFTQPAQPVLQLIGVQALLRDLEVDARSLLPRGVTFAVEIASPGLRLLADPSQLQQVFVNLLLNANDAMPQGGRVTVSAAVDRDDTVYQFGFMDLPSRFVRLTVSDSGSGMSSETMNHVFEPLFTTKKTGTGLGLAVTHQIIKHHGGEIFVESREGVGTSFHLFIPREMGDREEVPAVPQELQRPARCNRILLVEDDEAVAEGLVSILSLEGIRVDTVNRGALVCEAVHRFAPDAVILDVGLPDMSGIDVYLKLAATWPDLPVLFSTGEGDLTRLEKVLQLGNVGYLVKPYPIDVLLDGLSRLVPGASHQV